MIERAKTYAVSAHRRIDQRRKYTHLPYDVHLKRVAALVGSVSDDPELIAAAWLHDIVEDTPATFSDLEHEFGHRVSELVRSVTDVSRPSDGNRAARKRIDLHHLAQANSDGQTIKLADLIDNTEDICGHDTRFGRVFLREAGEIFNVLTKGDVRLRKRAKATLTQWSDRLEISLSHLTDPQGDSNLDGAEQHDDHVRSAAGFLRMFRAKDLARPLPSFDIDSEAKAVELSLRTRQCELAGLRSGGEITGYCFLDDLKSQTCRDALRHFNVAEIVSAEAPLFDVVQVLTRTSTCFVAAFSQADGFVTRHDFDSPIARMWLFGMVTLIEMDLTRRIRERWSEDQWVHCLSAARFASAQKLQAERSKQGSRPALLDCLQIADKAQILMKDRDMLSHFGFRSTATARRVARELQALRNHLAHAQYATAEHWPQIARMTSNFAAVLEPG